jgi:hypothetical protein
MKSALEVLCFAEGPVVALKKSFLVSVAMILLVTAILKIHASVMPTTSDYLDRSDEVVMFLSHRQLLLCAGWMELAIAVLLIRSPLSEALRLKLVIWVSAAFMAYRLARWTGHVTSPCGCLGFLASIDADWMAKTAIAWMLGGSTLLLLWPFDRPGSPMGSPSSRLKS